MKACDADGPVMVHVAKLYHTTDAQSFRAFGRVMSGTLRKGTPIKVLGEGYSPEDEEDMMTAIVENLWISESRLVRIFLYFWEINGFGTAISFQQMKSRRGILSSLVVWTPLSPKQRLSQESTLKKICTFSDLLSI